MSLSHDLMASIRAMTGFSERTEVVTASGAVGTLSCQLTAAEQLACSFEELTLSTDRLVQASIESLGEISEDLAGRLTYLLEPVAPIERDAERYVVQMRSKPPQQDDDGTQYYELIVERGEIRLVRYRRQSGQPRERISAHVTLEALGRLAADFEAAVSR